MGEALCRRYLDAGFQVLEFSRGAPNDFSVAADFAQPELAALVVARELASLAHLDFSEIVVMSNAGTVEPVGPTSRKQPAEILAKAATDCATTSAISVVDSRGFAASVVAGGSSPVRLNLSTLHEKEPVMLDKPLVEVVFDYV